MVEAMEWLATALSLLLAVAAAPAAPAAPGKGKVVSITTSSPEAAAAFLRGREQYENRHLAGAEAEFRRALALDPHFPSALSYLGVQVGGAEGLALARKAAAEAGALPAPEKLLIRSHVEVLEGKPKEARASLRDASALVPDDWHLLYYIGRLAGLDRLTNLALVSLKRAVQINPGAAPAWNNLGYMLANQGDLDGAIGALQTYERLLPTDPNPPDSLAEIYMRAGKLDEAEKAYLRSAERAPDATLAFLGLANVRLLRRDYDGGRQAADKARSIASSLIEKQQAERLIAWAYMAEGRSADALKSIQETGARARKLGATFPALLAAISEARMRVDSGDAAGGLLRAREALAPDQLAKLAGDQVSTVTRRAQLAVFLAALKLDHAAEAKAAAGEIQRMHEQFPESNDLLVWSHFVKGMLALQAHEPRGAIAELSRCGDGDAYCAWKLSEAQQAAGDPAAAAATRADLLQRNNAEQVYLDAEPLLIFVRGRLAAPLTYH